MDHINIIKRAWHLLWHYRVLWIFGFILALTTSSGGGRFLSNGSGGSGSNNGPEATIPLDGEEVVKEFVEEDIQNFGDFSNFISDQIPDQTMNTIITVGIIVFCLTVLLVILFKIARYIAEVSLISMVDEYENSEQRMTWRQGFRMGWSRSTWQIFLINLLIKVITSVVFLLILAVGLSPLLLFLTQNKILSIIGGVAAIGSFFIIVFFAILIETIINLLMRFFWRTCILEKKGIFDSIRDGFAIIRSNLKDIGIMWLIMVGIKIIYPIVLIPVVLLLIGIGVMFGLGGLAIVGGIAGLVIEETARWIVGGIIAASILFITLFIPLTFLGGLREVFQSSIWTLTYREANKPTLFLEEENNPT